jgi:antitoxin component YwqK of YwqJK toxin-antitoxin module
MTHLYSVLFSLLVAICSPSAFGQAAVCKYNGKEVDRWGPERAKFNGVVTCIRENRDGNTIEKHTYVNGHHSEESFDSPSRKEIKRYFDGSENSWLHGEQLEYFPRTTKLKSRKHYDKSNQLGLQEMFYESGKIKQKEFWVKDRPDGGARQTASIGYREGGGIQFIRCSDARETTLDPKLCGFDGKSKVDLVDDDGKASIHFVFEKGVKIESDSPTNSRSNNGSALQRGTLPSAEAARLKREKTSSGEKLTWSYEDGKIKRISFLDEKGFTTGEDSEYFPSGKPARKTLFEKKLAVQSECWWENGKPKAKFKRDGDQVTATYTWDTGVVASTGKYAVRKNSYDHDDSLIDMVMSCEARTYSLDPEGHFEAKRRDGTLEWSGDFKDGQPVGWQKQFDKLGKLDSEQLFAPGTQKKPGVLLERKTYQEGVLLKHEKFNSDGSIQE